MVTLQLNTTNSDKRTSFNLFRVVINLFEIYLIGEQKLDFLWT